MLGFVQVWSGAYKVVRGNCPPITSKVYNVLILEIMKKNEANYYINEVHIKKLISTSKWLYFHQLLVVRMGGDVNTLYAWLNVCWFAGELTCTCLQTSKWHSRWDNKYIYVCALHTHLKLNGSIIQSQRYIWHLKKQLINNCLRLLYFLVN